MYLAGFHDLNPIRKMIHLPSRPAMAPTNPYPLDPFEVVLTCLSLLNFHSGESEYHPNHHPKRADDRLSMRSLERDKMGLGLIIIASLEYIFSCLPKNLKSISKQKFRTIRSAP